MKKDYFLISVWLFAEEINVYCCKLKLLVVWSLMFDTTKLTVVYKTSFLIGQDYASEDLLVCCNYGTMVKSKHSYYSLLFVNLHLSYINAFST